MWLVYIVINNWSKLRDNGMGNGLAKYLKMFPWVCSNMDGNEITSEAITTSVLKE